MTDTKRGQLGAEAGAIKALGRRSTRPTKRQDTKPLTKEAIRRASTSSGDIWLSDKTAERGGGRLVIRVSKASTTCHYQYFYAGRKQLINFGPYADSELEGFFTLEQARAQVRHYSALHRNPQTADVRTHIGIVKTRARPATERGTTLWDLCEEYIANLRLRGKEGSAKNGQNLIANHLKMHEFASRPARSIARAELVDFLRELKAKKLTRTPLHMKALMHAAYNLALNVDTDTDASEEFRRFEIVSNPLAGTKLRIPPNQRTRNLDALELGYFWQELTEGPDAHKPTSRLVKLGLLLGGQRGVQLRRCLRENADLLNGTLLIFDPKGRRATPRPHVVPLSEAALVEVEWWIEISKSLDSKYLFPGTKKDSFYCDFSCSDAVAKISKRMKADGRSKGHFHHQDLRRTAESRMAQIGIHKDIRAQIQSHGISGVQSQHYDMWEYLPEKRSALEKWEAHLVKWTAQARATPRLGRITAPAPRDRDVEERD